MTFCRVIIATAMVGAFVGAVPLSAQVRADTAKVHTLDSLVVSGAPVRAAAPPVSTITVDPAMLRRTQATDPWDLVRRATGVEVHEQGQGPGFASNVVLRGFSSDHSSDALLVLDGVPINLPIHGHVEGYNDWSPLAAPAVGSMRVVHGPASPLYGDFNFGGVIEVSTPNDVGATSGQFGVSSYGDVTGWVRTGSSQPDVGLLHQRVRRTGGGVARQFQLLAGQRLAARLAQGREGAGGGWPAAVRLRLAFTGIPLGASSTTRAT